MRADPVHLSPDRDGLILFDSAVIGLNQHDSLAIAAEVRQVLQAHGLNLEAPHIRRWYIGFDARPDIKTADIATVAGQDINQYLPVGSDAKRFHQLLNEIQMQLHGCDINREREARGESPVNSVWFWGLGTIPGVLPRAWSTVYANDEYIEGLAMLSGTPCRPVPDNASGILDNLPENAEILVVLDPCRSATQYQDLEHWQRVLLQLEANWFADIPQVLGTGLLDQVSIVTDRAEFRVNRLALKKFWRRPRTLEHFIETY